MRSAIITLVSAILISIVAAYFSIVGLTALFPATALGVIIMGAVLETGKVVAAAWLHKNWKNPKVNWAHRIALCIMVVNIMAVTELGIYGFLYKGHMEQEGPKAGIGLQIAQYEQRITQLNSDNARLNVRLNQLDKSVEVFFNNDKASQGLRARKAQTEERAEINKTLDSNNKEIEEVQAKMVPLKHQTLDVDAKLGPVKNFAKFFGLKDDQAINIVILLIMSGFDPMAILLIISGQMSLEAAIEERKRRREEEKEQTTPPTIEPLPLDEDELDPEFDENLKKVEALLDGQDVYMPDTKQIEDIIAERLEVERMAMVQAINEVNDQRAELEALAEQLKQERESLDSTANISAEIEQTRTFLNSKSATLEKRQADLDANELELAQRVSELIELEQQVEAKQDALNQREADLLSWQPIIDEAIPDKTRILAMLERNPAILQDIIDIVEAAKTSTDNTL